VRLKSLGYMGLESVECDIWEDLGPRIFGFGLAERGPQGSVYLRMDDRHHRIAVHPGEQDRMAYIGWEVANHNHLEEAATELAKSGVQVEAGTAEECALRHIEGMVHFLDPAGMRHEIFWGADERYKSFTPGRPHGGFVTGEQGLGHIVLIVPDGETSDSMHRFLVDTLGFKVTDVVHGPGVPVPFYHLNARHHSLAIVTVPGLCGLNHILVEVNDLDDVGRADDLVKERIRTHDDLVYRVSLGRHVTDSMMSFYVDTPSGFTLEYGWGGRQLEDEHTVTHTQLPAEIWGHNYLVAEQPRTVNSVEAAVST
jgi:extradiol dioxygenase